MSETVEKKKQQFSTTRRLVETAILLAAAFALSFIKIIDLPYGGSVTACSMLPIVIVAYRYGTGWGLFTGFVYALLQIIQGVSAPAAGEITSFVVMILLDYVLDFGVLGLGGIWKKTCRDNQALGMSLGMLTVCILRYLCHVITGFTIWADASAPFAASLNFSLIYNATYMLPETIISVVSAFYIGNAFDFSGAQLRLVRSEKKKNTASIWMTVISWAFALAALIWDVVLVFSNLQNPDTGAFMASGFANVNWTVFGIVTGAGVVLWAVFFFIGKAMNKKKDA